MNEIQLSLRRTLARTLQTVSPGYGCCGCCKMPWNYCRSHTTYFDGDRRGCFVLCEWCWSSLTIEERLPYYHNLIHVWKMFGDERNLVDAVEKAVLAGG